VISYFYESEIRARLSEIKTQGGYDAQKYWMEHVYPEKGRLNEILDDALLVNHSEAPTASWRLEGFCCEFSSYANRDIKVGEMFTEDYATFGYPFWYE
jgi:hypothetical protein